MKKQIIINCIIGVCICFVVNCKKKDSANSQDVVPHKTASLEGSYGIVKEFINTSGYIYILVNNGEKEIWIAAPQTELQKGDTVSIPKGMTMPNYHSKTLDRTFDTVLFVNAIQKKGAVKTSQNSLDPHKKNQNNMLDTKTNDQTGKSHTRAKSSVKITGLSIPKEGKTIAGIFSKKDKLFGKEVIFRGKIVKANFKIMGTNWYHFQDGTGEKGSNDMTVTSDVQAKVGQVAVVKGILIKDKDFGSGYKYSVIIEKAEITVD